MENFFRYVCAVGILVFVGYAATAVYIPLVLENAYRLLALAEAYGEDTPAGKIYLAYSIISFVSCVLFPLLGVFAARALIANKKST